MVSVRIATRLCVPIVLPANENPIRTWLPLDLQRAHQTDVDPGDFHLVARADAASVGELRVVGGCGEQHRHTGEALRHPNCEQRDHRTHQPDAAAVEFRQGSHCGMHLPVGCPKSFTVRTGPPGCNPLTFSERSHR